MLRLLLALAFLLAAFVFLAPDQTTASTVIAGSVDCGRASGAACTYGPTLTLRSTDLGGKTITVDVSWLLDQLGTLRQDDWLSFEVEILPDGTVRASSIEPASDGTINIGASTGSHNASESGQRS